MSTNLSIIALVTIKYNQNSLYGNQNSLCGIH